MQDLCAEREHKILTNTNAGKILFVTPMNEFSTRFFGVFDLLGKMEN
jgi:hypothetical protein